MLYMFVGLQVKTMREKITFNFLNEEKCLSVRLYLVLVLYSFDGDGSTIFNERSRIRYAKKTSRFFLN